LTFSQKWAGEKKISAEMYCIPDEKAFGTLLTSNVALLAVDLTIAKANNKMGKHLKDTVLF